ncbi:phage tail tape measure protein [Pseudoxanthomonas winnipegensis]|uniref:phage tail length tape measure family protein n=1 Tax=Pseudoxanthomonas winnipegensis TaxID=2480810 RepID=UPI00102DE6DA|nr:phage tail length tape measure family protein [Pseudoxanthomonas winnipegensis]RZZ81938.1 phage tail tape measure protein [Pseudoxanthomonas winnipegensis]TAA42196.1 phage tail tape measure protein [Pseudoxanthomonas winnipegensis]
MADQTANLRVRISADLNDIKQGLGLVQRQVEAFKKSAAAPLPSKNPISQVGKDGVETSKVLAALQPQITDIITSLQGGMPFTTVLLQQGGQIRDMAGQMGFGFKDVGKALLSLVNPYTVAAAAVGVLALAWYKGAQEQTAYATALAATGSVAGVTTDQMVAMSEALAQGDLTQAKAAESLAAVAANGKIAGANFRLVAEAAEAMEHATGRAIEQTVEDFAALAKDPVAGVLKLDESMHFLTASIYEQIKALDDQGDRQEAARVATEAAHAAAMKIREETEASLGTLQRAWNGVKGAAAAAWSAMLNVGRADSGQSRFQELEGQVTRMQALLETMGPNDRRSGLLQNKIASFKAEMAKLQDANIKATKEANQKMQAAQANETAISQSQELEQYQSREQKRASEIERAMGAARLGIFNAEASGNKDLAKRIAANRDALVAGINKKYEKKGGASAIANATRNAGLQGFKDSLAQEQAQLKASTDALKAQYDAREITVEEYYAKLRTLTQQGVDAQTGALEKQIAYLKQQAVSGKDAIAVNEQIAQLESQLAVARTNGAAAQANLAAEEAKALKARQVAIDSYTAALQASNVALGRQLQTMVDKVGMGDREYEIQQRINDAYADEADKLLDLQAQLNANQIDQVRFDAERAALHEKTVERIDLIKAKYGELADAEADWTNGARAAWANYAQGASDLASQVASATGDVLTSLEDVVVSAASRSKVSSKDMADSIIKDLERIAAKQLILGLGNLVAGWFGNAATSQAQATGNYGAFNPNSLDWTRTQLAEGGMPPAPASWYTGPGTKFQPAGIVHAGEGVLSQRDVAAIGGPSGFMAMLASIRSARGYADGGLVGASGGVRMVGGRRDIKVELVNNGAPATAQATITEQPDGTSLINIVLDAVADDIANGGKVGRAGKRRYGWKEPV